MNNILSEIDKLHSPFVKTKLKNNMLIAVRKGLMARDNNALDQAKQKVYDEKTKVLGGFATAFERQYNLTSSKPRYGLNFEDKLLEDIQKKVKERVSDKFEKKVFKRVDTIAAMSIFLKKDVKRR